MPDHAQRGYSLLVAAVLLATGCAPTVLQGRVRQPAIVPAGWTAEYDYASGIYPYLRQQVDSAIVEGATAYIYIYSDRSERCRSLRRLMDRDFVSPLFRDVRISMLDFWKLHDLYKSHPAVAFDPGISSGVFVKIASDGTLSDAMFYAALFWYKPHLLHDFGYPDLGRPTLRGFATELQRFFAKNAGN